MKKLGYFFVGLLCFLQMFQVFSAQSKAKNCFCCLIFWKKKIMHSPSELEEMIVIPNSTVVVAPVLDLIVLPQLSSSGSSVHTQILKQDLEHSLHSFVCIEHEHSPVVKNDNEIEVNSPKGMTRTGSYISSTTAEIQHSSGTFRKFTSVEINNDLLLTEQGWIKIEDNES